MSVPGPDLSILARFLPDFENVDFSPGSWVKMQPQEDGTCTMPYVMLSPEASDFVSAAYRGRWVLRGFNWIEWKRAEEGEAFYRDPDRVGGATPRQLAQLLTSYIRQDRFHEGFLLRKFKSGQILSIVRRAAQLMEAGEAP